MRILAILFMCSAHLAACGQMLTKPGTSLELHKKLSQITLTTMERCEVLRIIKKAEVEGTDPDAVPLAGILHLSKSGERQLVVMWRMGMANMKLWVFRLSENHASLLLDTGGATYDILPTFHNGMRDLGTTWVNGGFSYTDLTYIFDGEKYRQSSCVVLTSDDSKHPCPH